MIKGIIFIVKIIIALLPSLLLLLLNKKINLPKRERCKQYKMPLYAALYSFLIMVFADPINNLLIKLFTGIPVWLAKLSHASWMNEKVGKIIYSVAKFLRDLIASVNLNFWVFFIANLLIIAAYFLVKRIIIDTERRRVKTDGKLFTKIAGSFYEYFTERDAWCIKSGFVQVRSLLGVFYYASLVVSVLLTVVAARLYAANLLDAMFYPVFGIIIVGECYFFLDGLTKREYTNDVLGEDEDAYKIVNYSLLRKFLRSLFGDKLLSENTSINNPLAYDVTTEQMLNELERDEDPKVVSFATYYGALNKTGFKIDHAYLHSSLDLMNGKSILFNNPFYYDLIPYAFYPMNRVLLSHKKVLVVLGRHAVENDITEWLMRGIEAVTNIPFMWNIGILNNTPQPELDIGIIVRSDVLNIELQEANADFFAETGYAVVIEPSKLISTAQIGLNLIVRHFSDGVVYCMCDKNCDGLVDAMSHILMTGITEVSATNKHSGTSSYMCWDTDEEYLHHRLTPNISRYLGVGTELSFAALKNQVSVTKWYGGEAFPVVDMNWIARQYYYELMTYAGLPTSQQAMDEHFTVNPSFWSAEAEQNSYLTVEDEAFNMFEILRDFSTRATEQGFINVVSSDYLLKEYMADNDSIFVTDAKAIPYIVPDYARTNRNTALKLILMLSKYKLTARQLERELSLLGIKVYDIKKQLWYEIYNCFASSDEISTDEDYQSNVERAFKKPITFKGCTFDASVINQGKRFNYEISMLERVYFIDNASFIDACVRELRSAGYVSEDEKGEKYYLGSELSGHIYQRYLPGQFFTFAGKYYEMQYLTADGQVLVRRAADHINNRPAYRQKRDYTVSAIRHSDKIGSQRNVSGMRITHEFADINVKTNGYYRMNSYGDFVTAKEVLFEENGIPERTYRNKDILVIELPENEKYNDKVRYTVTMLFNEVFKSVFAENQPFISAVTDTSFMDDCKEKVCPLTYKLYAQGCELKKNAIYIIEDSQLDLGLTIAVERNLDRLFKIVHDMLLWHMEAIEKSLNPPTDPQIPVTFTPIQKKKGFFGRLWDGIKNIFKRKKKDDGKKKEKPEKPKDEKPPKPEKEKKAKKKKDTPTDTPTAPTDTPTAPTDTPTAPTDTHTAPTDTPTAPTDTPTAPTDTPTAPTDTPTAPTDTPTAPTDTPTVPTDTPTAPTDTPTAPTEAVPKKKGFFAKLGDGIKNLFKRKKKNDGTQEEKPKKPKKEPKPKKEKKAKKQKGKPADVPTASADTPTDTPENTPTDAPADAEGGTPADGGETETKDGEKTDMLDGEPEVNCFRKRKKNTEEAEPEEPEENKEIFVRKPYHKRHFMLFGGEEEPDTINIAGTLAYLTELGFDRNPLKQARDGKYIAEMIGTMYKPNKAGTRYCDFCGAEIFGVEYETLADGRDRCISCSRTAIKTGEEFQKVFEDVKRNMEAFFGIKINTGIRVEMVNSQTLHKRLGKAYIPTPKMDGRVLGVAIKDKNGYKLYVENGSPRMMSMLTIAHELTHIWQYLNWNDKEIVRKYGKKLRLEIYEGMAKWAEIQYAYLINEPVTAKREEIITAYRDDEYGHGFLRYRAQYPFSTGTVINRETPFMNIKEPLKTEYCGEMTVDIPKIREVPSGNGIPKPSGDKPQKRITAIKGKHERSRDNVKMYAYETLEENERTVYNAILKAVEAQLPETDVPSIGKEQVQKILDFVMRDHPEIFWFRGGASVIMDGETGNVNKVQFTYCMSADERASRQAKLDIAQRSFLESITDSMSDYEVVLRVHKNITSLVDYDTLELEAQAAEGHVPSDKPDDIRSIYGVFVNRKAVCAGYAKAVEYLLHKLGIECGYVRSDTHAWNIVKLEGEYYYLDTTWDDGSNTKKEKSDDNGCGYAYFCITSQDLAQLEDHEPVGDLALPECTATACNYFVRHGLYFESCDTDRMRDIVMQSIEAGQLDVAIRCADDNIYNEFRRELIEQGKLRDMLQYSNLKSNNKVGMSYVYYTNDAMRVLRFILKK